MKKKIKRILSLIICIAVSLNVAAVIGVSAESGAYADEGLSSVVRSLGIDMRVSKEDNKVSYIDFLSTALDVVKFPVKSVKQSELVNYITDNNFVRDSEIFKIKPTDSITYGEALYAVVRMLGFEYEAENSGLYPSGYYSVAAQCELTDGLSGKTVNENINGEEAVRLIYNMLLAPYKKSYDRTEISDDYRSVLEELYDVYSFEGKVNATEISGRFSTAGAVGEGRIVINNDTYKISGIQTTDILGYAVEGFYIKEGSTKQIIVIKKDEHKNDEIIIKAEDILEETTADKIVYYDEKDVKRIVYLTGGVSVIYNGEAYPEYDESTFEIDTGEIRLIKGGDSVYSTVQVYSYKSYWVQYFNIDEYKVYDFYGRKLDLFERTADKKLEITDMAGNSKYSVDFRAYQVLWVAEAPVSKHTKIIISDDSFSGIIKNVSTSGGEKYVTVNGVAYKISDAYINSTNRYKVALDVGVKGIFYLDPAGEVFGVRKDATDGVNAGYVMRAAEIPEPIGDNIVKIQLMNENGDIIACECADTLIVDGTRQRAAKVMEKLLDTNNEFALSDIKRQLVLYKLNSEGKISFIDFAYKDTPEAGEGKDSLRVIFNYSTDNSGNGLFYREKTQSFGGVVAYATSAVQMQVSPKNSEGDDKDYFVKNGLFVDQKSYYIEAYSIGERLVPDFLVSYPTGATVSGEAEYFMYETSSKIYDAETDSVSDIIDGWFMAYETSGGVTAGSKSYKLSEDFTMPVGIDEGDLLKLSLNWKKEVVLCEVIYDVSEKSFIYDSNNYRQSSGWDAQKNMVLLSPVWEDSGYFKCAIGPDPTNESIGTYIVKPDVFNGILVYDSKNRRGHISLGSTSDIPTYENEPTTDCTIIYTSNWGDARGFVVYK